MSKATLAPPAPPQKAFNRTPAGLPLDEWQKQRNRAKRERRARKVKR